MNSYDWKDVFDRLDPTKVTVKCIKLGIRSSIVRNLIDFMNKRKMQGKMNNQTSSSYDLIGGSPQGSLIGQLLYIIGSDDAAEEVPEEDKFKYVDDLATLDSVKTKEQLQLPSDGPDSRGDLLIYITSDRPYSSRDLLIYITSDRPDSRIDLLIYITSDRRDSMGDLLMYITSDRPYSR